jgi:hypothetical protein
MVMAVMVAMVVKLLLATEVHGNVLRMVMPISMALLIPPVLRKYSIIRGVPLITRISIRRTRLRNS